MSNPRLPAELLDHVVDFLHHDEYLLRNCCLLSKSWIPRTRKHLFTYVRFDNAKCLRSWKETFPDPSTSPARYAKKLLVNCPLDVTAADAEAGGWIRSFSRVVALRLAHPQEKFVDELGKCLVPFHGFSPVIKSLFVKIPFLSSSQIFDLIFSFPLLEDLSIFTLTSLTVENDHPNLLPTATLPSTPPMTGYLYLFRRKGLKPLARRLLSLPGGIHFQNIFLTLHYEEDYSLATALVEGCSHVLKSLNIICEYDFFFLGPNLLCRGV